MGRRLEEAIAGEVPDNIDSNDAERRSYESEDSCTDLSCDIIDQQRGVGRMD